MKPAGLALVAALAAPAIFATEGRAADDVIVVRPLVAPHVLRVKPGSYVHEYPFGPLREDYTPYGMAGVPARLYFDRVDTRRVKVRRHVVRATY
ncbi:MAG: hypothetical protein U1E28_19200 [Beijerinckiaceae bacterium]